MARRRKIAVRSDHDSPWKETLQLFLPRLLLFFWPELHAKIDWSRGYQSLDKEFQQILRGARGKKALADKLFRIWLKNGKECWLLIHVEVQGQPDAGFGMRMFRYNYLSFELYHRPVLSMAILCDTSESWHPRTYGYGGCGSRMSFRFHTAKLMEYKNRKEELERDENPVARIVLAHLLAQETSGDATTREEYKLRLVKGLYDRKWGEEEVRQLIRIMDWLLALPAELESAFREKLYRFEKEQKMPYVTSFERIGLEKGREEGLEKGREEGLEKGRAEGLEQGVEQGRVAMIEMAREELRERFGAAGPRALARLREVEDLNQLKTLVRAVMKAPDLKTVRELMRFGPEGAVPPA